MRSRWSKRALSAFVVFSSTNADIRRFLRRLSAQEVKRERAPDSRFWFRIPLPSPALGALKVSSLSHLEYLMSQEGHSPTVHGPFAGGGTVLESTGAGAIPAHAKPSARRNAKYAAHEKSLQRTPFEQFCAGVFGTNWAPSDPIAFLSELDAACFQSIGLRFAELTTRTQWAIALLAYLYQKQRTCFEEWIAIGIVRLEHENGLPDSIPSRSDTLKDGAPDKPRTQKTRNATEVWQERIDCRDFLPAQNQGELPARKRKRRARKTTTVYPGQALAHALDTYLSCGEGI